MTGSARAGFDDAAGRGADGADDALARVSLIVRDGERGAPGVRVAIAGDDRAADSGKAVAVDARARQREVSFPPAVYGLGFTLTGSDVR